MYLNLALFLIGHSSVLQIDFSRQDRIIQVAESFDGFPYITSSLETYPKPEIVTCRTDGFDCMTFVETVLVMSESGYRAKDSDSLKKGIELWRYRRGKESGYGSRLHYASDWAMENNQNGLKQIHFDEEKSELKAINFMSENRSIYPALKGRAEFSQILQAEERLSKMSFKYLPSERVRQHSYLFEKGDLVLFVSAKKGLDIAHLGILANDDQFWHASSSKKKVVLEESLGRYLERNKNSVRGIQIYRLPGQ